MIYGPDGRAIDGPTEAEQLREALQEAVYDRRLVERDAELLAWHVLNGVGKEQDLDIRDRLRLVAAARDVWQKDPQAGAAIDLLNNFTFGRGVQPPRAKDPEVQKILDEAWFDPDNQLTLTSQRAQVENGTDLSLQSNVFFLMFEGEDGRVKLGALEHDSVKAVVRDPDYRRRVLYYKTEQVRREWDYNRDQPKMVGPNDKAEVRYYEHWRNVSDARDRGDAPPAPPDTKIGEGLVYHVAINKTSEMAFGVPTMRRLMRWFSAWNEYMTSRVDVMKAAAAFIMKRKVRGGDAAVQRIAQQRLNRQSDLAAAAGEDALGLVQPPLTSGGIINENDGVIHEALNLNTNAGNALTDGQMIRSQISAAIQFPQHYLGDAGSANLATATSMELPVLKHIESRQEVWEGVFRWFLDRVIEHAVETGRIPRARGGDRTLDEADLVESHPGLSDDEQALGRDLSYEFTMPNPLRRLLADAINSVGNLAKTFDPNGTNIQLSRVLLTIGLGELEVQDPPSVVKQIFPEGYQDPMLKLQQQAFEQQQRGVPGQQPGQQNPYGGPPPASPNTPAKAGDASGNPYGSNRGARARNPEEIQQARFEDLPLAVRDHVERRQARLDDDLRDEVNGVLLAALERVAGDGHQNGGSE